MPAGRRNSLYSSSAVVLQNFHDDDDDESDMAGYMATGRTVFLGTARALWGRQVEGLQVWSFLARLY